MIKLNQNLPEAAKVTNAAETGSFIEREESPLLRKVRQNYETFAGISLIFGVTFTFLFYQAGFGLNSLLFNVIMVGLLIIISRKLELSIRKEMLLCYGGVILLGLSSMLTASERLLFLNTLGSLFLLDFSLLLQFKAKEHWDFTGYLTKFLLLPLKSLTSVGMPFLDGNRYCKKIKLLKNDNIRNILIGLILAIPLLLIVTALLSSADLLFGKLTVGISEVLFSSNIYLILLMAFLAFIACYCIICGAAGQSMEQRKVRTKANPVTAITVTSLLLAVYVIFSVIQAMYLFMGGSFQLPAEFTYSEYARRGFFELLAVTCLNILLLLFCMNVFKESKPLRYLLTTITACTYVMIASSAYRMFLYIGEYHLTFLRVFVLLFLLIDALLLAGIILSLYRKGFPLFGYCVTIISVCYLIFSFGKPDAFIASYYINHTQRSELDLRFLTTELSYDAAKEVLPVVQEVYGELSEGKPVYLDEDTFTKNDVRSYYEGISSRRKGNGIRGFNISVYQAEKNAEKYSINWE